MKAMQANPRALSHPAVSAAAAAQQLLSWRLMFTTGRIVWMALAVMLLVLASTKDAWVAWIDHEITSVRVQGEVYQLNERQLQLRAQKWLGQSFLLVDLTEIKADLELEPWVFHATVSRIWPGNIVVQVSEQKPIAYWGADGLLNDHGQLFFPSNLDSNLDLPRLDAPSVQSELVRLEIFRHWQRLLPKLVSFGVVPEQLTQTPRGAWEISLANGMTVALGTDELDAKVDRLGKVLSNLSQEELTRVIRIDMRYPNGATVKWKS